MRLAPIGRCQVDVLEHHVDTGRRADKSDTRPHHPGAEHADFFRHIRHETFRTRTTGIDLVELEPEGANQVFRDLAGDQLCEVAGFNQLRRVEIHLGTLHRRTQDFLRRGQRTLGFTAQDRRCNRQHLGDFRVRRRATWNLKALHVPALDRRRIGLDPSACLVQQRLAIARQVIDQTRLQGLLRG